MTNEGSGGAVADATAREFVRGQKVFGRYTLIKILGRGGMGIVWLARDEELEHEVALKFFPDLIIRDTSALNELRHETKQCLELTHPHIVRVYDFVHDERLGCISMEYVDGDTLASLRCQKEQKVFEPTELTVWVDQLCEALEYAHNHARVIHRDLKPANLMINQRGELKISDFGVARSLGDSISRLTTKSRGSGTLVYMSPQQLDGERCTQLDDIYSLGASIYELLTSKPPFYSGNIDRQICERVAPSMTERRKELDIEPALVPHVWEDTVAACLTKDPLRRPQSAAEVAQRLQLAPGQTRITAAPAKRPNRKGLLVGGIAALSVLALAGLYVGTFKRPAKSSPPTPTIREKSIAVLPFENLSADQENAFFADGVQDEILTDLAKVAELKVISRTSVMQYKTGMKRHLPEIASALGVDHVVEGTVQRVGNRVRISAQLINAKTDTHLWAERYDRDLSDIFALESELAQEIVAQLKTKLSPEEKVAIEKPPTHDLVAYDLYARAKVLVDGISFNSARSNEDLLEAVRLLEQAVARDPAFFLAYYQLARVHDYIYSFGIDHTPTRLVSADAAVQTVLRLRPNSGEAHLASADHQYVAFRDYDRARQELAIASRALSNEPRVFVLTGAIDRRQGYWETSIRELEHALELDPHNIFVLQQVSFTYEYLRRFKEMIATLDRVLAQIPTDVNTRLRRAEAEVDWHADLRPLHLLLQSILGEDPRTAAIVSNRWVFLALCERDTVAAERALTALPPDGCRDGTLGFPRTWCEGLVARTRGDNAAAQAAFTRARAEVEAIVNEQPDYAEELCVLGMIDAALGKKADAIREGRRAVQLLPVTKDSAGGAALIKYLAVIYAWTEEKDLALDQLAKLILIPSDLNYGYLRLHPYWDLLRGDPRFSKLLADSSKPVVSK